MPAVLPRTRQQGRTQKRQIGADGQRIFIANQTTRNGGFLRGTQRLRLLFVRSFPVSPRPRLAGSRFPIDRVAWPQSLPCPAALDPVRSMHDRTVFGGVYGRVIYPVAAV